MVVVFVCYFSLFNPRNANWFSFGGTRERRKFKSGAISNNIQQQRCHYKLFALNRRSYFSFLPMCASLLMTRALETLPANTRREEEIKATDDSFLYWLPFRLRVEIAKGLWKMSVWCKKKSHDYKGGCHVMRSVLRFAWIGVAVTTIYLYNCCIYWRFGGFHVLCSLSCYHFFFFFSSFFWNIFVVLIFLTQSFVFYYYYYFYDDDDDHYPRLPHLDTQVPIK